MPKVSIVIPVFNTKPEYIQEAINSALNQTLKDIEIIIVNDGSTNQDTLNCLKSLSSSDTLKIIHQENKGLSGARNTGIQESLSEYILPLDSDDKIAPTYLEKAIEIFEQNPNLGMVYCKAEFFGAKKGKWSLPTFNKEFFIFGNCIFCSAVFKKETWKEVGKYSEDLKEGLEDFDFWLSFLEHGYMPYRIPEVLFFYRQHVNGSMISETNKKLGKVYKQIANKHPKLYLQNQEVINRIFNLPESTTYKPITRKLKKYKFLFKIAICANIILLILIISIIILKG